MKIIKAGTYEYKEFIAGLRLREKDDYEDIDRRVCEIIHNVRERGNQALIDYAREFDGAQLTSLKVSQEEIQEAMAQVGKDFIDILKSSAENIRAYHQKQLSQSWSYKPRKGITLGQLVKPLKRVGIYVPGGKAAYPSTVLMCAIPAQVAGVRSIAMTTPCGIDGRVNCYVLAAAGILEIDEIYKTGGAQAIGALAYGTETISPVDKIAGPGNIYVARAKKKVYGMVGIDMIAGPSEICIIGDETTRADYVAADLMSQAEHDERASAVLVTCSERLAESVMEEIKKQLNRMERKNIIEKSLENNGAIIVTNRLEDAFNVASEMAPEHMEVMLDDAEDYMDAIENAGAVFLGQYSPEPLGDYYAGPDHTLPTDGTARFASPLGVYDFMKKTSVISYSRERLLEAADAIEAFAEKEGLTAHANSIMVRR